MRDGDDRRNAALDDQPRLAGRALPEWRVSPGLTPYPEALAEMEARAAAIRAGEAES